MRFRHAATCFLCAFSILFTSVSGLTFVQAKDSDVSLYDYTLQSILAHSEVSSETVPSTFTVDYSSFNTLDYTSDKQFVVDVNTAINAVFTDHPELYYCRFSTLSTGWVATFKYNTLYKNSDGTTDPQLLEDYKVLIKNAEAIVSGVDASWSDYDKALYLHDALLDFSNMSALPNSGTTRKADLISAALVHREGTNKAYTSAYKYLLALCGISSVICRDSDSLFQFNAVKIDGVWYYVNAFLDDTDEDGRINHSRFLMNYTTVHELYTAYDNGTLDGPDDATTYVDDPIKQAVTPVYFEKNAYVYINEQGSLVACDRTTRELTVLDTVKELWTIFSGTGNHTYAKNFSALCRINGYYIYTAPTKLYVYNYQNGTKSSCAPLNDITDKEIYGIRVSEEEISLNLRRASNDTATAFSYPSVFEVTCNKTVIPVNYTYSAEDFSIKRAFTFDDWSLPLEATDDIDVKITADTAKVVDGHGQVSVNGSTQEFLYETYMQYDLDRDGSISCIDYATAKLFTIGKCSLSDAQTAAGDINGDSFIDSFDLLSMATKLLN